MSKRDVEYQSLLKFAEDLTRLIKHDIVTLSSKFFAKGLVTEDVHELVTAPPVGVLQEQEKAKKLLECVIDRIKKSPGRFQDFIDILSEEPYFEDIVQRLIKSCSKCLLMERAVHTCAMAT